MKEIFQINNRHQKVYGKRVRHETFYLQKLGCCILLCGGGGGGGGVMIGVHSQKDTSMEREETERGPPMLKTIKEGQKKCSFNGENKHYSTHFYHILKRYSKKRWNRNFMRQFRNAGSAF